jgi:hypothetical protein
MALSSLATEPDTNPALIVNQANAGSTGDLLQLEKEGVDVYAFTHDGTLKAPATFTIDPSAHGNATGKVIILGDLQVDGTTTTINSTTLEVDDKNIELSKGSANKAASDGAGISIDLGTDGEANLTYGATDDIFNLNKGLNIAGQTEISSANFPPLQVERTSASTNGALTSAIFTHTTSGDMVDGCGSVFSFRIKDNASVDNNIAYIGALRSGADNSGRLVFNTTNAGTESDKMTILPNGNVGIGETNLNETVSKLHIKGNVNINVGYLRWNNGNAQIDGQDTNLKLSTWTGSALTEKMRITSVQVMLGLGRLLLLR